MRLHEIVSYRSRLDDLFRRGAAPPLAGDPELQSHWARYLCVMSSGFLEIAVQGIFNEYARGKASPFIAAFVAASLSDFQNPKMEKILQLTQLFNPEWAAELRSVTEGELKDAVDSIVTNRHQIAHGRNVGITYANIRKYYDNASK